MLDRITLKAARINAGLTQKQVSEAVGATRKTVGLWEQGKVIPKIDKIDALCELYKVSYDNLIFLHQNNALSVTED